jgi:hypothetical protein
LNWKQERRRQCKLMDLEIGEEEAVQTNGTGKRRGGGSTN